MNRLVSMATAFGIGLLMQGAAMAEGVAGKPVPGGHHFQKGVTPVMNDIVWLDDFLHVIVGAITLFVVVLMAIVILKYNRKANPEPATFTHNTVLEVAWTALPVVILIIIAVPSLKLLFLQLEVPEPDVTIKVTGNQWYWTYEYPDEEIEFDAFMLTKDELAENGYSEDEYLLATDTRVVVPVNANVHVLVTASDVIHAWTIPSFGSKIDAMPGRINETWFRAEEVGVYFGQCSELCGKDHTYMPIVVEVMELDDYETWILETASNMQGAPEKQFAAVE